MHKNDRCLLLDFLFTTRKWGVCSARTVSYNSKTGGGGLNDLDVCLNAMCSILVKRIPLGAGGLPPCFYGDWVDMTDDLSKLDVLSLIALITHSTEF